MSKIGINRQYPVDGATAAWEGLSVNTVGHGGKSWRRALEKYGIAITAQITVARNVETDPSCHGEAQSRGIRTKTLNNSPFSLRMVATRTTAYKT